MCAVECLPERRRFRAIAAAAAVAVAAVAATAGCDRGAPNAAGIWRGAAGPTRALVRLEEGGTGSVRLEPLIPDSPVTWKREEGNRYLIRLSGHPVGPSPAVDGQKEGGVSLPATLSQDGTTLTVSFPMLSDILLTRDSGEQSAP